MIDQQVDNPYQHIQRIYWSVLPAVISGVLDNIRTSLAELISELLGTMPRGQEMPTPDQANQAVQVAVNGKRSRVTVMTAQASGNAISTVSPESQAPAADEPGFGTMSRKIGATIVGLATVAGAVIAWLQLIHH